MATDTDERVHVERTGVVAMDLPLAEAFPLFNAEGERRWVAGWDPSHVHPNEPSAGEGVIFRTTNKGVGTATWIQTRHDPAAGAASFVYLVPDHHAAMVDVHLNPKGEARSRASARLPTSAAAFGAHHVAHRPRDVRDEGRSGHRVVRHLREHLVQRGR